MGTFVFCLDELIGNLTAKSKVSFLGIFHIMDHSTAYSLFRKFQQLQEERTHAYKLFHEGHKIYMKTGPDYDFVQFRSLVQDITQDFKRIAEEIIKIECELRAMQPELSIHIAIVQDYEKLHLELMARQQLTKQELQDHLYDGTEIDILNREAIHLNKELATVQEKINENLQAISYQIAELV